MMDEKRQQELIDKLWADIEMWKQIACDKNVRIQALENESEAHRKALNSMTARYNELKREMRITDLAFQTVDRERFELTQELKALKEQQQYELERREQQEQQHRQELEKARQSAAEAREDAAALRGRLEALESLLPKGGEGSSKENA